MAKGKSGSFRANSLSPSDLTAMENHELRLDQAGAKRSVRTLPEGGPVPPLIYDPYRTGRRKKCLTDAYAKHTDGARINKGAAKISRHAFLQFPTDLEITPETEQMMLDQAVAFVNRTHGGRAVFRGRLDRDEEGRHGVDVFFAPRYTKTTKRRSQDWISLTKFGKKQAVARFGQKPLERKNEDGAFVPVKDADDEPMMVDCDSQYYQGRAFQDLWFEHLRDEVGLDWVVRGQKKIGRDADRLAVESYKVQQERTKLERDRQVQNEDRLEAEQQAKRAWADAHDAVSELQNTRAEQARIRSEMEALRENTRQEALRDAQSAIQAELDLRWARHAQERSEALSEAEERAWERIRGQIDQMVDERASERLQKAEEKARLAIDHQKALKRALDALWAVLRRLLGKDDFAAVKSEYEAELSKPAKTFDLRGPNPS